MECARSSEHEKKAAGSQNRVGGARPRLVPFLEFSQVRQLMIDIVELRRFTLAFLRAPLVLPAYLAHRVSRRDERWARESAAPVLKPIGLHAVFPRRIPIFPHKFEAIWRVSHDRIHHHALSDQARNDVEAVAFE